MTNCKRRVPYRILEVISVGVPGWWIVAAIMAPVVSAQGQTSEAIQRASNTIAAAELSSTLAVLASDSLRDRRTPGAGLERAARYVAARFEAMGLHPGVPGRRRGGAAQEGVWIQRYPVPGERALDYTKSNILFWLGLTRNDRPVLMENGRQASRRITAGFANSAYWAPFETPPLLREGALLGEGTILVAGSPVPADLDRYSMAGQIAVYVPPYGVDSVDWRQTRDWLRERVAGLIILSDQDSSRFAEAVHAGRKVPLRVTDSYLPASEHWVAMLNRKSLGALLASQGVDLERLRRDSTPVVKGMTAINTILTITSIGSDSNERPTAPNVFGVIEGTDSLLKQQYVVIAVPLDTPPMVTPDSGAGADLRHHLELAGALALAHAFNQPGAQPKRSVLFLVTSGNNEDFWGSRYFIKPELQRRRGEGGKDVLVLAMTLAAGGPSQTDSLIIDGGMDIELSHPLPWVAIMHPELGWTIGGGAGALRPETPAFVFAQQGIPSLDIRLPATTAVGVGGAEVNLDRFARALKLTFYVGEEIAQSEVFPRWTRSARARYLQATGP